MVEVENWNRVFENRFKMLEEFENRFGKDWIEVYGCSNGKGEVVEGFRKMNSKVRREIKLKVRLIGISYREYRLNKS